jgi:hypothetical protein
MSNNELIVMSGGMLPAIPGGKAVEVINAPLRAIAPALRAVASCYAEREALHRETDKLWVAYQSDRESANFAVADWTRNALLPRAHEVRQGYDLLDDILHGGHNIDTPMALKMVSVMLRVLTKKKDDPLTLTAFTGLFDSDIDSIGASLNIWKEVPRHPAVVALAVQRMFHTQVFAPSPAELGDECRTVADRLKARHKHAHYWLCDLINADLLLFQTDRDEWASAYDTAERLAGAPVGFTLKNDTDVVRALRLERDAAIEQMKQGGR